MPAREWLRENRFTGSMGTGLRRCRSWRIARRKPEAHSEHAGRFHNSEKAGTHVMHAPRHADIDRDMVRLSIPKTDTGHIREVLRAERHSPASAFALPPLCMPPISTTYRALPNI